MLKERVISALVGVPVILLFLFLGKYLFALLIAVIVVISIDELYSIFILREHRPNVIAGVIGGIAVVAGALFGGTSGMTLGLTALILALLVAQIPSQTSITDAGLTLLGVGYVAFTLSHMVLHYDLEFGLIGVLLVFIGTWASDIGAYGFGRALGKKKIAPNVSPGKTLEGLVAGLVVPAFALGVLFMLPWLPFLSQQGFFITLLKGLGMGLAIGVTAPLGDLIESRIKREMRVKDTGAIIPGHGGFLDRFDSVLFTSVVGYYYWLLIT